MNGSERRRPHARTHAHLSSAANTVESDLLSVCVCVCVWVCGVGGGSVCVFACLCVRVCV